MVAYCGLQVQLNGLKATTTSDVVNRVRAALEREFNLHGSSDVQVILEESVGVEELGWVVARECPQTGKCVAWYIAPHQWTATFADALQMSQVTAAETIDRLQGGCRFICKAVKI